MYQILRPISCHLSNAVQKKPDPSFLYIFPQIFLFNFSCVARSTSPLAHVQYPDASLSLSLSNSLLKLAYNNSSHIQTHTHIQTQAHRICSPCRACYASVFRRIDFLVLPIYTFFNFVTISDLQIFYIYIFCFIISFVWSLAVLWCTSKIKKQKTKRKTILHCTSMYRNLWRLFSLPKLSRTTTKQ